MSCLALLLAAAAGLAQSMTSRTNPVPIDLPTVLHLAGAQILDVRIARERLAEAKAENMSATLQFFPWVSVGITYTRHDGQIQDTAGNITDVNKQSYSPGGVLAAQWVLGDVIYKKLAAQQLQRAAVHELEAQRQDSLLSATRDYFELAFAQGALGVAREAVRISTNYEAQLQNAVTAGIAFKGDALRVSVEADRNRLALRQAAERQRLAAARLAQTLHLDPAVELTARESDLVPLARVPTRAPLSELVQRALAQRPELQQGRALAEAARDSKNSAEYGPLIPTVSAQAFLGGLGGGQNGDWGNFDGQQDYFVGLSWRLGPGGVFDFGRQRAARARLNSRRLEEEKIRDEIIRQVVDADARVQSQSDQISLAQQGLSNAEDGLRLAQQRQDFGVGRVLEQIQAEQDLTRSRTDYLKAISAFNQAQYEFARALGTPSAAP